MENRHTSRLLSLIAIFVLICLLFAARLINVQIAARDYYPLVTDGVRGRVVTIQAQRGEIFDCNGTPLVKNEYSYNITLDRGTLPTSNAEENEALLRIYEKISGSEAEYEFSEIKFPGRGTFPEYELDESFLESSENKRRFSRLLTTLEIEDIGTVIDGQTYPYAASVFENQISGFYMGRELHAASELANDPTSVTFDYIIDVLTKRYGLVDGDGEPLYDARTADFLLRLRYDMESRDFSVRVPYTVAENVDIGLITYLKEGALRGYSVEVEAKRVYCEPGVASHILGMTGKIQSEDVEMYTELGYPLDAIVGVSGVELAFEDKLHGMDGTMVITEDEYGNIIGQEITEEPVAGDDIYLTIDIDLQRAAEKALYDNIEYIHAQAAAIGEERNGEDANAGAIATIDVKTGAIRALASYPTYDLSTYRDDLAELSSNEARPLVNRALSGTYPPGSTFKPAVAAAALTEGIITPTETIVDEGIYMYYKDSGYTPRCWIYLQSGRNHGAVNVSEALRVSCNYFFYDIGRRLTIQTMNRYCRAFGLGEDTGIELPEKTGALAGPDYRTEHGLDNWNPGDTLAAAIGQSDNLFTPLQLSVYMSALINGGVRYRAHILDSVRTFSGETLETTGTEIKSQIEISQATVDIILNAMSEVVESGTTATLFDNYPIKVGGKTGTAQLGSNSSDNAVFVGFAPLSDPEIVTTCVIEHGSKGAWAGMAVRDVFTNYFDLVIESDTDTNTDTDTNANTDNGADGGGEA